MTFNNIQLGKGFMDQDSSVMEPSFIENKRKKQVVKRPQTATIKKSKKEPVAGLIKNGVPRKLTDDQLNHMSSEQLRELIKS